MKSSYLVGIEVGDGSRNHERSYMYITQQIGGKSGKDISEESRVELKENARAKHSALLAVSENTAK